MKKYSEVAPIVKSNIKKMNTEVERGFAMKDLENVLSKHNAASIADLPLEVKARLINGK